LNCVRKWIGILISYSDISSVIIFFIIYFLTVQKKYNMNRLKILLAAFVVAVLTLGIYSCAKDTSFEHRTENQTISPRSSNASNYTNYDKQLKYFAQVINIAINENAEFRNVLKTESMKQFDGDYNVLVKMIDSMNINHEDNLISISEYLGSIDTRVRNISNNNGNANNSDTTVLNGEGSSPNSNNNINNITPPSPPNGGTGGPSYIPDLIIEYPNIQIGIPLYCDDWNPNIYIPICTFIPDNDDSYDEVEGFQGDNIIMVDAINEPTVPVIVIGENERVNVNENIVNMTPNTTIILAGQATPIGIALSWTVTNPNNDYIEGYILYRLSYNTNQFSPIATIYDKNQLVYFDNNVLGNETYSYYLVAFNAAGNSSPSNTIIINSPSIPSPAAQFNANHYRQGEIELRWSYPQGSFIQNVKLYKRVIGIDNEYKLIGTFNPTVHHYIDNSVTGGSISLYRLELINFQGNSNPTYDFVDVPFRNISTFADLKLLRIFYDKTKKKEIEGWMRGQPEFEISIVRAGQSGSPAIVQKQIFCQMTGTSNTFNKSVLSWRPGDWAEILTIEVIEVDGGPKIDLNVNAGFDFKDSIQTTMLKGGVDISLGDITNTKNEHVGSREIPYRGTTSPALSYPMGGVRLFFTN